MFVTWSRAKVVVLRISTCLVVVLIGPVLLHAAAAQSVAASIVGTIYDEQRAVLTGAAVTVKHQETGQVRSTTSGEGGTFRLVGLAPGRYEMMETLVGFVTRVDPDIHLSVSEEFEINPTLKLAGFADTATVVAGPASTGSLEIALGRTITTKEIDELPIANRDFTTLALLTAGILENHSSGLGSSSGVQAAGLTGRSTAIIADGLTLDDIQASNPRGSLSLDAIQEFRVLSNGFSAEYGQAAGTMISVVTRAGTNQLTGRVGYYHRDDAWDATPAEARLVVPPLKKSKLAQKLASGFLGGPMVPNHLFFFGSAEDTLRDTENIVTSPVLSTLRPGAPDHVPVHTRLPQVLVRTDANVGPVDSLTVRYRLSQISISPNFVGGTLAPERGVNTLGSNQDAAILANQLWGALGLNELRVQFAREFYDNDPIPYCDGCFEEDRPGILLGKGASFPNSGLENRWQAADSVTLVRGGLLGEHTIKTGIDASVIDVEWTGGGISNQEGTFTFNTDKPFDLAIRETYPLTYTRAVVSPRTSEHTRLLALFAQDEWKLLSPLTLNVGLRWDYQDAPGVSGETGKVAPRLGLAWDLSKTGKTVFRANYGHYYDQVFLRLARDADQAKTAAQILLKNPGYPDPFGFNPVRIGGPITVSNTTQLAGDLQAPYTSQGTIGIRREAGSGIAVSLDGVWARGHHLFLTHDVNYPDLTDPAHLRPNKQFEQILEVQSHGHAWYDAVQIGVERRHIHRFSFTAAYTLSSSERDTEDYTFRAQDPRNEAAERGPSSSDVRHRLAASVNVDLPLGLRLSAITTTQSALPYSITIGARNADGAFIRPDGVGRNSARGTAFWQTDARLSRVFRTRSRRVEMLAEAFNLTNRANWTAYQGNQQATNYGRPTSTTGPREVQVGMRVEF